MKKILSFVLSLAVSLSVFPGFTADVKAEETAESVYSDVSADHWAYKQIEMCKNLGIISGYPDGSFKPENNITRAEAVKISAVISGRNYEITPEGYMADIDKTMWYAPYYFVCKDILPSKWIKADEYLPENAITREDAVYLVLSSLGYEKEFKNSNEKLIESFKDSADISPEFVSAMAFATENGIIKGNPDGSLLPKSEIKRCEIASILCMGTGLTENPDLKWEMENVKETNAIKKADCMLLITSKDYFKTDFTVEKTGYYDIEMGYAHDTYETYFRFDTEYADGTAGGFMQGFLHGKTKINMNVYLKKGVNKINIRHHSSSGTQVFYIKNNGLTEDLPYEISPKNEKYFTDSPKELKTQIKNYHSKLVKIEAENGSEISFKSVNKYEALKDTLSVIDDFYGAAILVTPDSKEIEALGEGTHKLKYHLENGVILEQEITVSNKTPESDLKFINFSVGKANSTLIMLPNGKNLLVDSATKQMAKDKIIPYLKDNGIKLDYYLLTHFHADHNGLKADILKEYGITSPDVNTIKQMVEKGNNEERYAYLKNFGYVDSKMLRYYDKLHEIWDLGGVEIDITNSRYDETGKKNSTYNYPYMRKHEHNYENSSSVSFFLNYKGFRYFHSADIYSFVMDRIKSDMIKMGRENELRAHWFFGNHHFINDMNAEFINTLNPVAVFIPTYQLERRGAYWYHYKENVENFYYSHKRMKDTLSSEDIDSVRVCVNSSDDWYYETLRY